jgi:4a-hydroxytetrahydrobiopterin dehydratase
MADGITSEEFLHASGNRDWQVIDGMAAARFRTCSFAVGVTLVNRIADLAEAANHHPDIDLRYRDVTVRLSSHDIGGLSKRDVRLAQEISRTAQELDVAADPD